jgi:glucose dehydrogenase
MSETISTITRSSFRVVRVAAMAAIVFASVSVCWLRVTAASHPRDRDWRMIGGSPGNLRYSGLDEINRTNVAKLTVAWTYDTGELGGLETTPLVIDGVLYGLTPRQEIFALNAATGQMLWKFSPGVKGTQPNRGPTWWTDGKERRLLCGVMNFLYALDPATGKPILSFGQNGRIDLREGLGRDPKLQSVALTSPGVIYKDMIIVGGRNPETLPAPPGDIRAFDVHSGQLRWAFHTIPHEGEFGAETWPAGSLDRQGAANNWAGMAVDQEHGIVFVPTGSAVSDFYGGTRVGDDLFADTLLALDANTGKRLWHFQGVHHDIWDRDFPSAPILLTIEKDGERIPAIGQTTKQGFFYFFNRLTGKPLFPIENRPVAPSTTPGEIGSTTQPYPLLPAPFAPQNVTEATLTQRTPEAHAWAVERLREIRNDGQFVPLSVGRDTLVSPSFEGGGEWGGPATDPETGIIYVNANAYASLGALAVSNGGSPGRQIYTAQCAVCHGISRQGSAGFPALLDITKRLHEDQIVAAIHQGKGRMPAMPVEGQGLQDLLAYLHTTADATIPQQASEEQGGAAKSPTVSNPDLSSQLPGAKVYAANCAICHGDRREGIAPSFPTLIGVSIRYSDAQMLTLLHTGKGRMPSFTNRLSAQETEDLLKFLRPVPLPGSTEPPRYIMTGYRRFVDPDGYPATATPWGTLSALDPRIGKYLWQIPLGEYPELAARGIKNTGSENYGGPVVTAGGLIFIAATNFDHKIRVFDKTTGKLLWEATLPFPGNATPAIYEADGHEYVVIAAGGSSIDPRGTLGGVYVAFALPK